MILLTMKNLIHMHGSMGAGSLGHFLCEGRHMLVVAA